jgi:hypothetical protein
MKAHQQYFPVNWIDGMKVNKDHFIAQDDAWRNALHDAASLNTSPIRFGVLASPNDNEDNFNVKLALDNQHTLRVTVLACRAVTPGGVKIDLPSFGRFAGTTDGVPSVSFPFAENKNESGWWVVLTVHPYERQPAGEPDPAENPPRYPYVLPSFSLQVVSDSEFGQYAFHPYAIAVGRVVANGNSARVDTDYIPPCYSISASPDLVNLHAELDVFMTRLETLCSQIVQKILVRNQQNEISDLVKFLCDRMVLYLSQAITNFRWTIIHESPAALFASVATLARVMKNSIDLRTGSGKEEMMNYLTDWCELRQGELESLLSGVANTRFDNNDINKTIQKIIPFVKVTGKLFETLSKLDFIGKRKESGIFVKEETNGRTETQEPRPVKRRFLG